MSRGQHYLRGTTEATHWCNRCSAFTQHRVDDVKLGPCLRCLGRLDAEKAERDRQQAELDRRKAQQPSLF